MTGKPEVEKIAGARQSYHELAGRNRSRLCWEATRPRDHPVGSSRRGTERGVLASALFKNHIGSVDLDALKIPARKAEYSLTGSALSPFQAEPTHTRISFREADPTFLQEFIAPSDDGSWGVLKLISLCLDFRPSFIVGVPMLTKLSIDVTSTAAQIGTIYIPGLRQTRAHGHNSGGPHCRDTSVLQALAHQCTLVMVNIMM
jgi:hypothetical protein